MKLNIQIADIDKIFAQEEQRLKAKARENLVELGNSYIAEANSKGNYQDRTRKLRNGNGYALFKDETLTENKATDPDTQEAFRQYPFRADIELVVGNGVPYASFVEGKGFDVASDTFLTLEGEAKKKFR